MTPEPNDRTPLDKPEDDGAMYLIRKAGRGYYRPNAEGYTLHKDEAGRYTLAEAISCSHPNGPDGPRDGIDYIPAPPTPLDFTRALELLCDGTEVVITAAGMDRFFWSTKDGTRRGCIIANGRAWDNPTGPQIVRNRVEAYSYLEGVPQALALTPAAPEPDGEVVERARAMLVAKMREVDRSSPGNGYLETDARLLEQGGLGHIDAWIALHTLAAALTPPPPSSATPAPQSGEGLAGEKYRRMLLDLLATIHRDGGHKTEEIGIDLAHEQAIELSAERAQRPATIRQEAMEEAARIAEAEKVDADATGEPEDEAYNKACDHIAFAIRSAKSGSAGNVG